MRLEDGVTPHAVEGARESAAQLVGMWSALVRDYGGEPTHESGVDHIWADADFGFYNALTFRDPDVGPEELRRRLAHSAAVLAATSRPGFLWLFEELLRADARAILDQAAEEAGLVRALTCYGMAGAVPVSMQPPDRLRFERVRTRRHLNAYAYLNARAYGIDVEGVVGALAGSRLWTEGMYAFVGYEDDRPVCCAAVHAVDGRLFVAFVATEPSRQRLGYGEAVTRLALLEGASATGLTRATLHATEAGRPVYRRLGLEVTSHIPLYTLATS